MICIYPRAFPVFALSTSRLLLKGTLVNSNRLPCSLGFRIYFSRGKVLPLRTLRLIPYLKKPFYCRLVFDHIWHKLDWHFTRHSSSRKRDYLARVIVQNKYNWFTNIILSVTGLRWFMFILDMGPSADEIISPANCSSVTTTKRRGVFVV
jgi:hypothetical protein